MSYRAADACPARDFSARTLDRQVRGLAAAVFIVRKENVLIIPRRAVMLTDGVPLVQVKTAAGLRARPVRLGAQDGMNVEILEGLKEDDVVAY